MMHAESYSPRRAPAADARCAMARTYDDNASRERNHGQKVDWFKAKLRSLDFRYLAVVLQPKFKKTVEVDQFDVNGAIAGFATRLP